MELVDAFMDLFEGLRRAHGTYQVDASRGDGKLTGKAATLVQPVTKELWEKHLKGERSLGIVPINDDSRCKFGAIDIDVYAGFDIPAMVRRLDELELPLVAVRSKSGGAHLYLFADSWVPAGLIQIKLKELAAGLGYGSCEIFPKQIKLHADKGDVGQWINMPYFDYKKSTRYAVTGKGTPLNAEEFVKYAYENRVSLAEIESLSIDVEDVLEEGPPCLQHLITRGFPEGTRNNGLYNLGVYLRKSFPDTWKTKLLEWNFKYMKPPLPSDEVLGVTKSVERKEYQYTCSKVPIVDHCNSIVCRMRKFGIGTDVMPRLGSLTKVNTDPPTYLVDIEGHGRVVLSTDDLLNPRRFRTAAFQVCDKAFTVLKEENWNKLVNELTENMTVIDMPEDASPVGQMFEHLENFCTGRAQAKSKEELILGRPWFDEENQTYWFRSIDFMKYLERQHFKEFNRTQVAAHFKNRGMEHVQFSIKKKTVNVWGIYFDPNTDHHLPVPKEVTRDGTPY